MAPDGLLVWAGEEDDGGDNRDIIGPPLGDSLSLELQDGRLILRYNLGSGFAQLIYNNSGHLDDGQWHSVRIYRFVHSLYKGGINENNMGCYKFALV